ncbi:hypothetical protein SMICM17S_10752 [Streptomyces microflavus]
MYGAEHLQAFGGLPAVDFQPKDDPADRPAADDVAWRISVEPYGDDDRDRPWEQEFADFLDAVDPAGVRALIIGQWRRGVRRELRRAHRSGDRRRRPADLAGGRCSSGTWRRSRPRSPGSSGCCHALLEDAGVPVPASPTSGRRAARVRDWSDVRALMREHRMPRAFVKLAHGSSASGVLAVETAGPGRVRASTSVERDAEGRLFNSLRVRRYTTEREVGAIVDALAPDGLHIERWLPKASQRGRAADLRIVVVGGRATHAVVRTSLSPMTNLHLGGARGDLDEVRAAVSAVGGCWREALAVCERAAACFPGTLCVGVDLLPAAGWRRFAVGEVNAFGDLLPGLTGLPGSGAEGLDTYAAQVAAVLDRARNHRAVTPL